MQKKKIKEKEIKKGEIAPPKGLKQQKTTKDRKKETSVESKEAEHLANVRHPTWNPKLELDGTALPWNSSIREFQKGHAYHVAEVQEHPFLLPKDMEALRKTRQPELSCP